MRIEGPSGLPPSEPQEQKYVSRQGDTLRSIAGKFQIQPEALAKENNLQIDDEVGVGKELRIPVRTEQANIAGGGIADLGDRMDRDSAGYVSPFEERAGLVLEDPDPKWSEYVRWSEKGMPGDLEDVIQPPDVNIKLDPEEGN